MDKLITFSHIIDTFGFVGTNETDEAALKRARDFYQERIDMVKTNLAEDGREKRIDEYTAKRDSLIIETWEQYLARQRAAFLTEPKEITKEHWWQQYEVLPPAGLIMADSFTEFYISEAYTMGWHSGYLHDHKTGKYWSGMVDAYDPTTRLCVRLGLVVTKR